MKLNVFGCCILKINKTDQITTSSSFKLKSHLTLFLNYLEHIPYSTSLLLYSISNIVKPNKHKRNIHGEHWRGMAKNIRLIKT